MDLKNLKDGAGDLAKTLADKAEGAIDEATEKLGGLVPASVKEKAEDLADKAVDKATELVGKAADKLEGK